MINFAELPRLHIGPMSANVMKAVVAFARAKSWPVCLIASRRQIDSEALGGGYVDGLTTERFVEQLREAVKAGHIILARDHGGPYQRADEEGLSLAEALDSVERSYRADIENGFNIIHIDPEKCIKPGAESAVQTFTELTQELLKRCFAILDETGREDVRFEVGTDEGIGMEFTPDQWAEVLESVWEFCVAHKRPAPVAIAVPLGTKVKELENVGGLALNPYDPFWTKRVQAMRIVAERFGVKLKLHNADYIAIEALQRYMELGVEQINVAPELGVAETRALIAFLRDHDMENHATSFLRIAYDSKKWERWLRPGSNASNEEKAMIAGHYVFATPECRALLEEIRAYTAGRIDTYLIEAITHNIENYYSLLEECHAPLQNVSA